MTSGECTTFSHHQQENICMVRSMQGEELKSLSLKNVPD